MQYLFSFFDCDTIFTISMILGFINILYSTIAWFQNLLHIYLHIPLTLVTMVYGLICFISIPFKKIILIYMMNVVICQQIYIYLYFFSVVTHRHSISLLRISKFFAVSPFQTKIMIFFKKIYSGRVWIQGLELFGLELISSNKQPSNKIALDMFRSKNYLVFKTLIPNHQSPIISLDMVSST